MWRRKVRLARDNRSLKAVDEMPSTTAASGAVSPSRTESAIAS
jgi:hypothetical protein